jgi:hypothetical protein
MLSLTVAVTKADVQRLGFQTARVRLRRFVRIAHGIPL